MLRVLSFVCQLVGFALFLYAFVCNDIARVTIHGLPQIIGRGIVFKNDCHGTDDPTNPLSIAHLNVGFNFTCEIENQLQGCPATCRRCPKVYTSPHCSDFQTLLLLCIFAWVSLLYIILANFPACVRSDSERAIHGSNVFATGMAIIFAAVSLYLIETVSDMMIIDPGNPVRGERCMERDGATACIDHGLGYYAWIAGIAITCVIMFLEAVLAARAPIPISEPDPIPTATPIPAPNTVPVFILCPDHDQQNHRNMERDCEMSKA